MIWKTTLQSSMLSWGLRRRSLVTLLFDFCAICTNTLYTKALSDSFLQRSNYLPSFSFAFATPGLAKPMGNSEIHLATAVTIFIRRTKYSYALYPIIVRKISSISAWAGREMNSDISIPASYTAEAFPGLPANPSCGS